MKRYLFFLIVITAVFYFNTSAQSGLRYALVIGNAEYNHVQHLKNPINDARLMKDSLKACGFSVMPKENLKYTDFQPVLDQFYDSISKKPCEAFFYYSGHGIQKDGENYLIPVDANLLIPEDIAEYCFPLGKVLAKLAGSKSKINIIVLDACRDNPFSTGFKDLKRGLNLVTIEKKESFIVYSTDPNNIAHDGSGKNSPFAAAFAKHMNEPGLSINDLLIKVTHDVTEQYPSQRPWGSVCIKHKFYFVPAAKKNGEKPIREEFSEPSKKTELAQIGLVCNVACTLFMNDEAMGELDAEIPELIKKPPGEYRIRIQSLSDSSIFIDTVCTYTTEDPVITFIDLQKRIQQKKDSIEYDPGNILIRKTIKEIEQSIIKIPGGEFQMGYNSGDNDEIPEHRVKVKTYYLSKHEVTQNEWVTVMGSNPSYFNNCTDCPVENVSWDDANKFIEKLNQLTNEHYRLPTEAEWEFAARGGSVFVKDGNKFSGGLKSANKYGWINDNSSNTTHSVEIRSANELGLFDMTGNVEEWCSDWYSGSYYSKSSYNDPQGPNEKNSDKLKVVRGGYYSAYEINCTNFTRDKYKAEHKDKTIGFRIAKDFSEFP
jgi:formylglycine-generating enzyme required for sulfatase activity